MPRLLFINRVFPPTPGATGQLLWELTADLARRGHEVTVLAARAPEGTTESRPSGVKVVRYGGASGKRTGLASKAVGYARQYPSLAWRLRGMSPMDGWVSMTDPPLQAVAVAALKPVGTRLIHWAQDVYPEVAEELGVLRRGGAAAGVCRRLAISALRRHDRVVAVGRCMATRLHTRDPDRPRPDVIPNWAPLPEPRADDDERRQAFRASLAPTGARVVMYSGNFGRAHPFEAIADAVRATAAANPPIHWAFIGEGPKFPWMREAVGACPHTRFLPSQPWADLRVTLSAADLHLASMEDTVVGTVVPSKVYGALAVGRPCLLLGPAAGEAAQLICDTGAGWVMEKASGDRLAAELVRSLGDHGVWTSLQSAAAAAVSEVSRERCLERWADVIGTTLSRPQ
ncbi:MAG: glycosyltransferase family 4 protein [Verrucomicrobiales bacterium]